MTLQAIFAQLSCTNLNASTEWFTKLFGREPDARPMKGLAEWHHGDQSGFQLFENKQHAGRGTLTLIVRDLHNERTRCNSAGLEVGSVQEADYVNIVQMYDLDGNMVVLAEPK